MIRLASIDFEGKRRRRYLLVGNTSLPRVIKLEKSPEILCHDKENNREVFLYKPLDALVKIKIDKYTLKSNPIRWIGRIIQERLFLQVNGRKEYIGNAIHAKAGLEPVETFAWGLALNPFNRWGSIYFMRYCPAATNGAEYFRGSDESEKMELIENLCEGTAALARYGYYNRDQHFGNVLIDSNRRFVWIDTHVTRLPLLRKRAISTAIESTVRKIPKGMYRDVARSLLEKKLNGSPPGPS